MEHQSEHQEREADPIDKRLMYLMMLIFLVAPLVIAVLLGVSIIIGGSDY